MLLRVSSNQQLDADGDLSIQRQIIEDYISSNKEWFLDDKEYFEGSNSGYKNSVEDRDILQEALDDAKNGEYNVLAVYKDDRIGRRMWEIGAYVMQLKQYDVDIYSVKDGKISPESDDIMGQMMLALRYGNAQKSSSDTGMRVKDTAQKLVKKGKFMGGKAPYGYSMVLSGEISKHGRVLHKLEIDKERAEVVKHIYSLSLNKEYGSSKIARILNEDPKYKMYAPHDYWKAGTVTSILTNPIYTGITAYKRREKRNGKIRKLGSEDWITAEVPNTDIIIIDADEWNRVQDKRRMRAKQRIVPLENQDVTVIQKNDGNLCLIDVAYCGHCGSKLANGTKYNYWTIKDTGERKISKERRYKCQGAWNGIPHEGHQNMYKSKPLEDAVFDVVDEYIKGLLDDKDAINQVKNQQENEKSVIERDRKKIKEQLAKLEKGLLVMEEHVADAINGEYVLTIDELASAIRIQKRNIEDKKEELSLKDDQLRNVDTGEIEWNQMIKEIPTWSDVLRKADVATKRVLINKIIKRIDVDNEKISIKFRINFEELGLKSKKK